MNVRRSVGLPLIGANVALLLVLSACDSSSSSPTSESTSSNGSSSASTSADPGTETGIAQGEPGSLTPGGPIKSNPPGETQATEPPPSGIQNAVLESLPGSNSSDCVSVGDGRDLRSGDLAAGNFETARQQYADDDSGSEQPVVSLYVIPRHTKPMSGVTVTMKPMGRSGKSVSVSSDVAQTANAWSYYSVSIPVPSPGAWRLTAVSGADRGCFDVTFTA